MHSTSQGAIIVLREWLMEHDLDDPPVPEIQTWQDWFWWWFSRSVEETMRYARSLAVC
jgi:hypothetical protein